MLVVVAGEAVEGGETSSFQIIVQLLAHFKAKYSTHEESLQNRTVKFYSARVEKVEVHIGRVAKVGLYLYFIVSGVNTRKTDERARRT